MSLSVTSVNSDTMLTTASRVYLVDASNNFIVLRLPDKTGMDGVNFIIKRIDTEATNVVTLVGFNNTQLINSLAGLALGVTEGLTLVSFNNNWYTLVSSK